METYKVMQLEPAINDVNDISFYIANNLKNQGAAARFSKISEKVF